MELCLVGAQLMVRFKTFICDVVDSLKLAGVEVQSGVGRMRSFGDFGVWEGFHDRELWRAV
jgi:hypothetical protein